MDLDRDTSNTDECLVTALQIFDYCGADSTGTLHVDALMDKCAPSVKTNNAEFSYLKTLLDPNHSNPEIDVSRLANALNEFSDSQKTKLDLDESFNLKSGTGPQDSDSGISNDGFLLLEELQTELRVKSRHVEQLRAQLNFADRQHEDALAALSAERDSLRAHLTMLRDENTTLHHVRRDYEEASERLCGTEQALSAARRERDALRRERDGLLEHAGVLDAEKLTLQELLSKSKEECHRINEMYASRQASLLEQNELLKRERAELAARLQDQEDLVQQMLKEKVILEMELKDVLNRSNQTQLRLDRSIDVSYTEDQMLTALDSLNQDSRFSSDNHVLDEDAFVKALKDQELGRASNLSLFDEIRLSFCNVSRRDIPEAFGNMSKSQLEFDSQYDKLNTSTIATQTDKIIDITDNNNKCNDCPNICLDCERLHNNLVKTQSELKESNMKVSIMRAELIKYENDLNVTQKRLDKVNVDKTASATQTDEKPIEICINCMEKTLECKELTKESSKVKLDLKKSQSRVSNVEKELNKTQLSLKTLQNYVKSLKVDRLAIGIQTDAIENVPSGHNNNVEICGDCTKQCLECMKLKDYTAELERQVTQANNNASELQFDLDDYENKLAILQNYIDEGINRNNFLEEISKSLQTKLEVLESACVEQREKLEVMAYETCCVDSQTDSYDVASVSTQAEVPCVECEKRSVAPQRSIRRLLWEPLKCLFQGFAVLCFLFALSALYGVTRRGARCERELPWRWLDAQELMDMLLRIEYVADVPM